MRSLDELHTIDWAGLEHAYGDASDVPELLRGLVTDKHEQALGALYATIVHQGGRYEATAHAVPFLLGLAADPATPARADLVRFLGVLAIGDDEAFLPAGVDVVAWRARVARLQATEPADAYKEFDGWVAAAATEDERRERSLFDPVEAARGEAAELAAYEAVLAGAPVIAKLLDDSSAAIRAAAVYVLGWLPSSEPAPRVRTLLVGVEPDGVVGNAVVTLGLLGVPPATVRPYLGHACPAVRWAAAIALARLGEVTPQVVEALSGFVVEPPRQTEPPVHFHDGDFRGYAAVSVAALRDKAPSSALGSLLTGLGQTSGTGTVAITVAVLGLAFGPPDGVRPPAAELTEAQRRTVHTLAELNVATWRLVNFTEVLRDWRLPSTFEEMWAYAGR